MPAAIEVAANFKDAHIRDGNINLVTAYFTDPATICSGERATKDGYIGDSLYLVFNNGPVKIPLKEDELAGTPWTLGKCFVGMGK